MHELCRQRGYHKKSAKAVLKTRLEAVDAVESRLPEGATNDMDTSSSLSGKRARNTEDPLASEAPETGKNGKRPRGDALVAALAVDVSVAQAHAHWRNPARKPQVGAFQSPVVGGVDGAFSAWVAGERSRVLGQKLSPEEAKIHAGLVHEGKLRELAALKKFDVYTQSIACNVP